MAVIIPDWLKPQDFIGAARAGAAAGLQRAQMGTEANIAGARLEQARQEAAGRLGLARAQLDAESALAEKRINQQSAADALRERLGLGKLAADSESDAAARALRAGEFGLSGERLNLDKEKFADEKTRKIPVLTPGKIGEREVVIGPGGAVHYVDELTPLDKAELQTINASLRGVEQQARTLAADPNTEVARALNAQRQDLAAKKQAVSAKYEKLKGPPTKSDAPAVSPSELNVVSIRDAALQAIKSGKDPAAVRARFKEKTGKDADF